MTIKKCDLLDYLLEKGLLDCAQATIITIEHQKTGKKTETLVRELGFLSKDLLLKAISRQNNIEYIELQSTNINHTIARTLSKEYCAKHNILIFDQTDSSILIAIVQEVDLQVKDYLSRIFDKKLVFHIVDESVLMETIDYIFSVERNIQSWVEMLDQKDNDSESFATRLVYELLSHCVRQQVSDIHIEPEEFFVRIRLRRDGLLYPLCVFPKEKWPGLCVRIKILANMDISQSLLPQDGRFDFSACGKKVDLRVSSRPIVCGENIVIRVLDQSKGVVSLEELGYSQANLKPLNHILQQTNGVFIVTGPTGSGKSTLLFAMLMRLHKSNVSIATIEDPVEYTYPYFRQTDLNTYKNLSCSQAIKSILRQDPDIISINEIRDSETAIMAMRAAMTGRMVLTTLHTNDIFGIFDRMSDLGVEKKLLLHHLNGIATQRLIRKVCCCAKFCAPTLDEQEMLGEYKVQLLPKIVGCEKCHYTGYQERFAVCQVLHMDEYVSDLFERQDVYDVKQILYNNKKLLSLKDEMRLRVQAHQTTLEEVNRVVYLG